MAQTGIQRLKMNHSVDDDMKHCREGKTSCIPLSDKVKDGFE